MRRIFSLILFLFGFFVMVLSVLTIFFKLTQVDLGVAVGMAAFGLILCVLAFFVGSAGVDADSETQG